MWGIFLKENPDELIGCIGVYKNRPFENRGFWLAKKFWGQGLMTEAVKPVMRLRLPESRSLNSHNPRSVYR